MSVVYIRRKPEGIAESVREDMLLQPMQCHLRMLRCGMRYKIFNSHAVTVDITYIKDTTTNFHFFVLI